ncbi:hypothetical protein M422DRAFT_252203 [Sphaerobolus stellatus SS14]|uniref:Fungal-type protein kinase domain-containing protein n=1 Tax=Sphaerobolus stellatus (strain SS14) TaxID=990650 RepID=A0A0C9VPR8_SPHS4|nr:hypothetical protein M422DRAFT_252203 [Sphaerobolus stellatus SS14]
MSTSKIFLYDDSAAVKRNLSKVDNELSDSWYHDPGCIEHLFPMSARLFGTLEGVVGEYYNKRSCRWKTIYAHPSSVGRLCTLLATLLNNIALKLGVPIETSKFLNTLNVAILGSNTMAFSPGVFLAGTGPEFASFTAASPVAKYENGISAIDVCLDVSELIERTNHTSSPTVQMMTSQRNRRFAYGLIMYNHQGVIYSDLLNCHGGPEQFVAIIASMISDAVRIRGRGRRPKLKKYIMEDNIYHYASIPGRGTVCMCLVDPADELVPHVWKDAWIEEPGLDEWESEGYLLTLAKERGINKGIPQIEHFENVHCSSKPDTIFQNRRLPTSRVKRNISDRIHIMIIMRTYGKPFNKISNPRKLLFAFHDAVIAHRRLRDGAKILHRDVSMHNILINPDGEYGNHGILIDFDPLRFPILPYWGEAITRLVHKLHLLFCERTLGRAREALYDLPEPAREYDEFLEPIRLAAQQIKEEPEEGYLTKLSSPILASDLKESLSERRCDSYEINSPRRRKPFRTPMYPPRTLRSRRLTANSARNA